MNFSYLARLFCLCLAAFFLVHATLAVAVSALTTRAVRMASRMAPAHGARLLLALRLFPSAFALFVVAGLCTPSYLYLEPKGEAEEMGVVCLAAALMSVVLWGASISRASRAVARSLRHLRQCRERSREMRLPGDRKAAWIVDANAPCVMLAGVLRPRMVISRNVVSALTVEQLAAVVRHEQAHGVSRDNLKRLLVLLAPGILPFAHGLRNLERAWVKLSEWAADDRAAAGKTRRSLTLAAALVRVARLGTAEAAPALATSLMADSADLSERVDRLLHPTHKPRYERSTEPVLMATAGLLVAGALVAVLANPVTLHSAHEFLEFLIQ